MAPAPAAPVTVPSGTRVVHIGPPKTGTTTIQALFHEARAACEAQGVHYAGRLEHSQSAIHAAIGRPLLGRVPSRRHWRRLRSDILGSPADRVILSSEALAYAAPPDIERLVHELGDSRVRIVVTLRPLAAVLPSQWQQNVQSGTVADYAGWLKVLFDQPDSVLATTLWPILRHHDLVARWARIVGIDRVIVVVPSDRDRSDLPRAFEALLGLRSGTLGADLSTNRSLTLDEVEVIRNFNHALRERGIQADHGAMIARVLGSQITKLREPSPTDRHATTPTWATDRIAALQADIVATLAASGVAVVGDLARLADDRTDPDAVSDAADPTRPMVPASLAGSIALDLLIGAGVVAPPRGGTSNRIPDPVARGELPAASTPALVRALVRRLGRARRLIGPA